jgi:SAM-dependent methyltransferase
LVPTVVGIDRDRQSVECARTHPDAQGITYVYDDFLTWRCAPDSFDLITAVASVHHMDATAALQRMRELLRPGGVLAIVGLARGSSPVDFTLTVPAAIGDRVHRLITPRGRAPQADGYRSPVCWPPPVTYRDVRRLARRLLPGAHYRRHLYWRYSLTWRKPLPQQ